MLCLKICPWSFTVLGISSKATWKLSFVFPKKSTRLLPVCQPDNSDLVYDSCYVDGIVHGVTEML